MRARPMSPLPDARAGLRTELASAQRVTMAGRILAKAWKLTDRDATQPSRSAAEHKQWLLRCMEVYAAQVDRCGKRFEHARDLGVQLWVPRRSLSVRSFASHPRPSASRIGHLTVALCTDRDACRELNSRL